MKDLRTLPLSFILFCAVPAAAQTPTGAPWDSVSHLFGAATNVNAGTYRYNMPRSDLHVSVSGVRLLPGFALVSWAGFGVMGSDTAVMGDIVATNTELPGVLRRMQQMGISVNAIHNHIVGETPRLNFIHYMGHGGAVALAAKVASVLSKTALRLPIPKMIPTAVTIDTAQIFRILGARGRANGALAQLSFNFVPGGVIIDGMPVPAPFSTSTPINMQRVSADRIVGNGDFTVTAAQVDAVQDALAEHGILATAMHSHLVGETPKLYYIHFWADGSYASVLSGLRAAVDAARQ